MVASSRRARLLGAIGAVVAALAGVTLAVLSYGPTPTEFVVAVVAAVLLGAMGGIAWYFGGSRR